MPKLINWELASNPFNWVIVLLMCLLALIFVSLISPDETSSHIL